MTVQIHSKLWLEHGGEERIGTGRVELLRRIEELGSLKKAAERLNMSYRAAWGRIKRTEAAMRRKLLEDADGMRLPAVDGTRRSPAIP